MKKLVYVLSAVLPAIILFNVNDANAQRRNTTSHDVRRVEIPAYQPESEQANIPDMVSDKIDGNHHDLKDSAKKMMKKGEKMMDCGCKDNKDCQKGCKMNKKLKERSHDIEDTYNDAIEKINKSSFNADQKKLLINQAQENRNFATQQLNDRKDLQKKQMKARMDAGLKNPMQAEKANRKAVKEVNKIIWED